MSYYEQRQSNSNKSKNNNKNDQYPVSVNHQQCIGPCYYSGTRIIHPLTLDEIRGVEHNFCPVNTFVYVDPQTKKTMLSTIDRCVAPTAHETQMNSTLWENVIAPQFQFSSDYFVKVYYKIFSLEDLLKWLDEHKTDPYKTKERVFNNSMAVYGDQITIIDHRLVNFVNDIMNANLPKLYRALKHYIHVVDGVVKIVDPNSNKSSDENTDDEDITFSSRETIALARSYIKTKFLGMDNISQFMSKFIRYYKVEMTDRYISNILVNHMIDYCVKRIKMTLEQQSDL